MGRACSMHWENKCMLKILCKLTWSYSSRTRRFDTANVKARYWSQFWSLLTSDFQSKKILSEMHFNCTAQKHE
jgi:hypothetical protein